MRQYRAVVKDYDVVRFTRQDLETALDQLKKSGAQEIGIQIEQVNKPTERAFGTSTQPYSFGDVTPSFDEAEYCMDCGAKEPELCWCERCNWCCEPVEDCDC